MSCNNHRFFMTLSPHKNKPANRRAGVSGAWVPSMVWRIVAAIICWFAMGAGTPCAAQGLTCETHATNWKWQEFRCPLTINIEGQPMLFKADFSGSHDDTRLSMTLSIDGVPVACNQNSKTSLLGEDGSVSLECHFSLDGSPGTKRMLGVLIQIWHAQLDAIKLSSP
jgi:hypothetical protein